MKRVVAALVSLVLVSVACGGESSPDVGVGANEAIDDGDDIDASSTVDSSIDILTAEADADDAMTALGTFTLRHDPVLNCLYHEEPDNNGEPGTGGRVVIVWPHGYTAVADDNGVAVLDATGTPVARTDVAFQMAGGGPPADTDHCNAIGVWVANGPPIASTPATNDGERDEEEDPADEEDVGSDLLEQSDSSLDCLADQFLFAGFVMELATARGMTIDESSGRWPQLVVDFDAGVDATFELGPLLTTEDMDQIELSPILAAQFRSLPDTLEDRDVYLVGRGFPTEGSTPRGFFLLELVDDQVLAFDECLDSWRDITAEMALATRALDTAGPLEALGQVVHNGYDTGQRFVEAWAAAGSLNATPWVERSPTERSYVDPDIPAELLDRLMTWRVHISYPQVTVDGTVPYAICARQSVALAGSCLPFAQTLLTNEVVLEALIDPDLPIEISLVNIQAETTSYGDPLAVITDLDTPTLLTLFTTLGPDSGHIDIATAAASVQITIAQTTDEILSDPQAAGLELIGDLGPFRAD